MISSIEKVQIAPLQRPINGCFSVRAGGSTVTFALGATEKWVLPATMHLNMRVRLLDGSSTTAAPVRPNNNDADGTGVRNISLNSRVGCLSLLQSVQVSTKSNRVLEHCRNVGRMTASTLGVTKGYSDFDTVCQQLFGATSNDDSNDKRYNQDVEVSIPLHTILGTFSGENIPLSAKNGINGLEVTVYLQPNASALYGEQASLNSGSYYEIRDLTLSGSLATPATDMLPPIKGFTYNNYSSYYTTLQQQDENISFNVALKGALAQFANYIPSSHLGNYSHDEYITDSLLNKDNNGNYLLKAPIRQLDFLKNGMRFPNLYSMNFSKLLQMNVNGNYDGSGYDALRQRNFMDAIKRITKISKTIASPLSEVLRNADVSSRDPSNFQQWGDEVYGTGCAYDKLGVGATADFSSVPFQMRLRSMLDGLGVISCYLYFLHKNYLEINSDLTVVEN